MVLCREWLLARAGAQQAPFARAHPRLWGRVCVVAWRHLRFCQSNGGTMKLWGLVTLLLCAASVAIAEPMSRGAIEVLDGDTIRAHGRTIRLVGYDTPEAGSRAKCESERTLASEASFRLRQLLASGAIDLKLVPCSCKPGTEGTQACNYGRSCGVLTVAARDVGQTMIGAGLARPYHCNETSCPQRSSWCDEVPPVTVASTLAKPSARSSGGCGSRGGAGYRLPNGKCAGRKR